MIWLIAAAILVLLATVFLSALNMALVQVSESAFQRRLDELGRSTAGAWISGRWGRVDFAVSFLRTWGRVGFFALILCAMALQPDGSLHVDAWILVEALAISAIVNWIFTTVVSGSMARYAAVDLIVALLPLLRLFDALLRPITAIGAGVDEAVKRLTGANLRPDQMEEELLRSIEDTQRQGGLDPVAAQMLESVVEFTDTQVSEVMTPRTAIEGLAYTDDITIIRGFIKREGHSRIPVFDGSLDNIVGILYVKDLVAFLGEDPSAFALRPLLRQPIRVPEGKKVRDLLVDFQRGKVHMAIVIDEYGGTAGLVTIEDVLEEIVGEIRDEHEPADEKPPELVERGEEAVEVEGRYPILELGSRFGVAVPEDAPYTTVAGHILAHLGRVPERGAAFEWEGLRFSVLEATATAVKRVLVERVATAGAELGLGAGPRHGAGSQHGAGSHHGH